MEDLVTFTEEILEGKLHFLCSVWQDFELVYKASVKWRAGVL